MQTLKIKATQPQADFHALTCKHPAFIAGFGCVHPETKIATEFGFIRICDIKPLTRVLSWNEKNQKFQLSVSGGSYPKGKGSLYRVTTKQGEFVSSGHHRIFSSSNKYLSVENLSARACLKTAWKRPPKTNQELAQLLSILDVQHLTKKDEDYLLNYVIEARLYGQQLHQVKDIDQSYLPLEICARKSCQSLFSFSFLHKDDLMAQKPIHSHRDQLFCRTCKSHSGSQKQSRVLFSVNQILTSPLGRTFAYLRKVLRSVLKSVRHHNIEQHSPAYHSSLTFLNETSIETIKDMGEDVYWDMQVIGTNNYVTIDGCIHHNSGKSETMANQAILDASHSSSALIGLYEPTYDLVRLIMAPRIEQKLSEYGIRYKYNKSENIIHTSNGQFGDFILRTLDNPARIIGYETYRAHIDEIDTLKKDKAIDAWTKIIARNRQRPDDVLDPFNRVSIYSTPEGFKFAYEYWKKNPRKGYELIQASTLSNPFLPDDYVDTLKETYPEQLIEAYINGDFVNLTSGTVYNNYDRKLNNTTRKWNGQEPVFIGMDFNVGQMAAVIHVKDDNSTSAVDEISSAYDTPEMINIIKSRYRNCTIRIYPDASGNSRKSVDASRTDIALLQQAGFQVIANKRNPFVKDRVLSMNKAFKDNNNKRIYLVNSAMCPNYADCLEQQVWNDNGEPDKTAGNDHMNDAGGYYICYEYPVIKPITTTQQMIV